MMIKGYLPAAAVIAVLLVLFVVFSRVVLYG